MIVYLLSKFITICFGMLYPAYSSYKAIKTKDAKEYVQWMMYWIVFSVYSIFEIFSDAFFGCWFPFYYEIKILFMFWMLSPTTRGGSTLYRRFIHPALTKHEQEIDGYLADAKRTTGNMVTRWGSRALSYVTDSFVRIVLRLFKVIVWCVNMLRARESENESVSSVSTAQRGVGIEEFHEGEQILWDPLPESSSESASEFESFESDSETESLTSDCSDVNEPLRIPQAPHMAQEYVQRSPSRRPIHQAGYPIYSGEEYPDNGYAPDSPSYEMDAADGFAPPPNMMHAGRSNRNPNANDLPMSDNESFMSAGSSGLDNSPPGMPPAGVRKQAQMAKKLKNEFGNFSMVTAQDGSMNNKPIIFGWYPYSETPTVYSPDISSGVLPSVFPSVLPTVPIVSSQEVTVSNGSSISSSSSSKAPDATVVSQSVNPVEISPTDEFADPLTSEEHSVDDFFDCEEVEKKEEGKGKESAVAISKPTVAVGPESTVSKKPAVSPSIKVVGKTNLQAFDEKPSSGKSNPKTSVDNLARHSSSESLAAVKRKTASLTSLSKLDKTKARKSFSGTESKPKVALFSSQSFRRVLHPFVSSKSLTSSHSSKNVSRSSSSVDASKDISATKPDKS